MKPHPLTPLKVLGMKVYFYRGFFRLKDTLPQIVDLAQSTLKDDRDKELVASSINNILDFEPADNKACFVEPNVDRQLIHAILTNAVFNG